MKDIFVSIEDSESSKSCLDAALILAKTFDAHITGHYEESFYGHASYAEVYSETVAAQIENRLVEEKKLIAEMFAKQVKTRTDKCSLIFNKPFNNDNILSYTNLCDIVVCAQHNNERKFTRERNVPEHLIMSSGKPVLIIPYIGLPETLGNNILIAWDNSREASRAIHDALPLLKRAKNVHVFSVNNKKRKDNEIAAISDLIVHLEHHGVSVDSNPFVTNDVPVAEMLLSRASDYGSDLIVMGAYGHSRLREYTLGGATRTMLGSMTVPVLMTH